MEKNLHLPPLPKALPFVERVFIPSGQRLGRVVKGIEERARQYRLHIASVTFRGDRVDVETVPARSQEAEENRKEG